MSPSLHRFAGGLSARILMWMPVLLSLMGSARAAESELELGQMSLEDLLQVEVSGVSRKVQRLTDTAAAAYVLTADDIRRSGATSLPEVLRLVPGLEVARIGSSRWAVSARGFNSRFANKLQVLMDGRSVYSPLFSGVFWEAEDVLLDDIERIEVIRGPGAALWGANAVNGVINIVTRSARRTQGELVTALAGDEDRVQLAARHGASLSADTAWRVWAKAGDREAAVDSTEQRSGFGWHYGRLGARVDGELDAGAQWTVVAGLQSGHSGENLLVPQLVPPYAAMQAARQENSGGHVLARLEWGAADGALRSLQASVDQASVNLRDVLREQRLTWDLDFQTRQPVGARHDVVWGGGLRYSRDRVGGMDSLLRIAPERDEFSLWSAFVHDEFSVVPDRVKLIWGTKLEHHSHTGLDWQPNVRWLWTPAAHHSMWTALSRSVRLPSRAESDASVDLMTLPPGTEANPGPLPVLVRATPGPALQAEKVVTVEAGYRAQLADDLSVDLAAYRARYRDLRSGTSMGTTVELGGPVAYVLALNATSNALSATTQGLELAADWHVLPQWRLQLSGNLLHLAADRNGDPANDADAATLERSSPRHQWVLRSALDLAGGHQIDVLVRRVGARASMDIPAYTGWDLRWAWRVQRGLELSVVGENLLGTHAESNSDPLPSQRLQVPRAAYVKLRWQL